MTTPADHERDLRALEGDIVSNACYWQACGETDDDAAALRDVVQQYRRLRDAYLAATDRTQVEL